MSRVRLSKIVALTSVLLSSLASPAHAQISPVLTITNGWGMGDGGFYYDREQLFLDGLVAARRGFNRGIGAFVGAYGGGAITTNRAYGCISGPSRRCLEDFPSFAYFGLALGGEVRRKFVSLTAAGGPGAFRNDSTAVFGILLRSDLTFHVGNHFAWVVSGSTRRVKFRGDVLFSNAIGVGIRVD